MPSTVSALAGTTYAWDIASDTLAWGPSAPEVLGLPLEDLPRTGEAFAHLLEPCSGPSHQQAISSSASGTYDTRYALRLGPAQVVIVQDSGRWQPDTQGRPAFVRGQLRADPASGKQDLLPARIRTRSDLLLAIQNAINDALLYSHTCTLIVGSFENDEVETVESVARMLRPMMRRRDHFAPLGPRRFALTLTCCPASEASTAMRRLARLLEAHPACASLRLGAASSPDHTFQATKLLRFAEQALARSIGCGEAAGVYDFAHAAPQPVMNQTSFDLIRALNERRLTLACRPVADARTRAPALLQACAAQPGQDGRLVPLGPLPQLEEANLALLVDGRMLELAADHLHRHPHERLVLPISPRTLHDAEWLDMLAAHLGARPGIASRLMIEVPESVLADAPAARGRFNAMKALGVGIALSGFGTGYASFAHLQILPIDLLKIDGVFIQTLKRSTDDRLYVRTLIDRAHHLGIAVSAEWVDDEDTARMLMDWGVDYLQGRLFGEAGAVQVPSLALIRAKASAYL